MDKKHTVTKIKDDMLFWIEEATKALLNNDSNSRVTACLQYALAAAEYLDVVTLYPPGTIIVKKEGKCQ